MVVALVVVVVEQKEIVIIDKRANIDLINLINMIFVKVLVLILGICFILIAQKLMYIYVIYLN